jgi:hypothetical protein
MSDLVKDAKYSERWLLVTLFILHAKILGALMVAVFHATAKKVASGILPAVEDRDWYPDYSSQPKRRLTLGDSRRQLW